MSESDELLKLNPNKQRRKALQEGSPRRRKMIRIAATTPSPGLGLDPGLAAEALRAPDYLNNRKESAPSYPGYSKGRDQAYKNDVSFYNYGLEKPASAEPKEEVEHFVPYTFTKSPVEAYHNPGFGEGANVLEGFENEPLYQNTGRDESDGPGLVVKSSDSPFHSLNEVIKTKFYPELGPHADQGTKTDFHPPMLEEDIEISVPTVEAEEKEDFESFGQKNDRSMVAHTYPTERGRVKVVRKKIPKSPSIGGFHTTMGDIKVKNENEVGKEGTEKPIKVQTYYNYEPKPFRRPTTRRVQLGHDPVKSSVILESVKATISGINTTPRSVNVTNPTSYSYQDGQSYVQVNLTPKKDKEDHAKPLPTTPKPSQSPPLLTTHFIQDDRHNFPQPAPTLRPSRAPLSPNGYFVSNDHGDDPDPSSTPLYKNTFFKHGTKNVHETVQDQSPTNNYPPTTTSPRKDEYTYVKHQSTERRPVQDDPRHFQANSPEDTEDMFLPANVVRSTAKPIYNVFKPSPLPPVINNPEVTSFGVMAEPHFPNFPMAPYPGLYPHSTTTKAPVSCVHEPFSVFANPPTTPRPESSTTLRKLAHSMKLPVFPHTFAHPHELEYFDDRKDNFLNNQPEYVEDHRVAHRDRHPGEQEPTPIRQRPYNMKPSPRPVQRVHHHHGHPKHTTTPPYKRIEQQFIGKLQEQGKRFKDQGYKRHKHPLIKDVHKNVKHFQETFEEIEATPDFSHSMFPKFKGHINQDKFKPKLRPPGDIEQEMFQTNLRGQNPTLTKFDFKDFVSGMDHKDVTTAPEEFVTTEEIGYDDYVESGEIYDGYVEPVEAFDGYTEHGEVYEGYADPVEFYDGHVIEETHEYDDFQGYDIPEPSYTIDVDTEEQIHRSLDQIKTRNRLNVPRSLKHQGQYSEIPQELVGQGDAGFPRRKAMLLKLQQNKKFQRLLKHYGFTKFVHKPLTRKQKLFLIKRIQQIKRNQIMEQIRMHGGPELKEKNFKVVPIRQLPGPHRGRPHRGGRPQRPIIPLTKTGPRLHKIKTVLKVVRPADKKFDVVYPHGVEDDSIISQIARFGNFDNFIIGFLINYIYSRYVRTQFLSDLPAIIADQVPTILNTLGFGGRRRSLDMNVAGDVAVLDITSMLSDENLNLTITDSMSLPEDLWYGFSEWNYFNIYDIDALFDRIEADDVTEGNPQPNLAIDIEIGDNKADSESRDPAQKDPNDKVIVPASDGLPTGLEYSDAIRTLRRKRGLFGEAGESSGSGYFYESLFDRRFQKDNIARHKRQHASATTNGTGADSDEAPNATTTVPSDPNETPQPNYNDPQPVMEMDSEEFIDAQDYLQKVVYQSVPAKDAKIIINRKPSGSEHNQEYLLENAQMLKDALESNQFQAVLDTMDDKSSNIVKRIISPGAELFKINDTLQILRIRGQAPPTTTTTVKQSLAATPTTLPNSINQFAPGTYKPMYPNYWSSPSVKVANQFTNTPVTTTTTTTVTPTTTQTYSVVSAGTDMIQNSLSGLVTGFSDLFSPSASPTTDAPTTSPSTTTPAPTTTTSTPSMQVVNASTFLQDVPVLGPIVSIMSNNDPAQPLISSSDGGNGLAATLLSTVALSGLLMGADFAAFRGILPLFPFLARRMSTDRIGQQKGANPRRDSQKSKRRRRRRRRRKNRVRKPQPNWQGQYRGQPTSLEYNSFGVQDVIHNPATPKDSTPMIDDYHDEFVAFRDEVDYSQWALDEDYYEDWSDPETVIPKPIGADEDYADNFGIPREVITERSKAFRGVYDIVNDPGRGGEFWAPDGQSPLEGIFDRPSDPGALGDPLSSENPATRPKDSRRQDASRTDLEYADYYDLENLPVPEITTARPMEDPGAFESQKNNEPQAYDYSDSLEVADRKVDGDVAQRYDLGIGGPALIREAFEDGFRRRKVQRPRRIEDDQEAMELANDYKTADISTKNESFFNMRNIDDHKATQGSGFDYDKPPAWESFLIKKMLEPSTTPKPLDYDEYDYDILGNLDFTQDVKDSVKQPVNLKNRLNSLKAQRMQLRRLQRLQGLRQDHHQPTDPNLLPQSGPGIFTDGKGNRTVYNLRPIFPGPGFRKRPLIHPRAKLRPIVRLGPQRAKLPSKLDAFLLERKADETFLRQVDSKFNFGSLITAAGLWWIWNSYLVRNLDPNFLLDIANRLGYQDFIDGRHFGDDRDEFFGKVQTALAETGQKYD